MDETSVKTAATEHAEATVAGDFKTAGSTLTEAAMAQAPGVMKAMPGPLKGSEIRSVEQTGDEYLVAIEYQADEGSTVVHSRWAEVDGRPMITGLELP